MKKIIDGKRYDTETAIKIGEWDYECYGNFNFCSETLYQKKNGEFFLHGDGGANSKYAQQTGDNTWSGGEEIIPLSYEDAKKWVEKNLDADTYEKIFGEVIEDDSAVALYFMVTSEVKEKLDKVKMMTGKTYRIIIEELVNNNL